MYPMRKIGDRKVKEFYQGVLGMPVIRSWGEPELAGFMFDTGAGLVEVFTDAEGQLPQGSIRHFALKTDDVDGCVKAVREAGYPITVEPKDIVIPSQPEFPVRVAFCNGPVGEEIESSRKIKHPLMDRAVLYMKLYTFGMPFMNCTIAEIIYFK